MSNTKEGKSKSGNGGIPPEFNAVAYINDYPKVIGVGWTAKNGIRLQMNSLPCVPGWDGWINIFPHDPLTAESVKRNQKAREIANKHLKENGPAPERASNYDYEDNIPF